MNQSSNELSQELGSISDAFSSLGERLLGAARQLHSPGSPPAESLIEELDKARRGFLSLRDRSRERAEALHVVMPADESLNTTQGLTALLDLLAEAEIRQGKGEETRRRALAVLDRVMSLSHSGGGEFAPLAECKDRARSLREGIAQRFWLDLPSEAGELAEGDHVFASLLALIEDREVLNDDAWSTMHDAVGDAFGKSLAAAAARAKLVLPARSDAQADATDDSPDERPSVQSDKSAGRRNLGKATPSPR